MRTQNLNKLLANSNILGHDPVVERLIRAAVAEDMRAACCEAFEEGYAARQNDFGAADSTPNPYARKAGSHERRYQART